MFAIMKGPHILILLLALITITTQDAAKKKGCDCKCKQADQTLAAIPVVSPRFRHEEAGKPGCNICEHRKEMLRKEKEKELQFQKCPFEILGTPSMKEKTSEELFDGFRELLVPSQNGFFDMLRGVVKTMHVSSESELKWAKEKEAKLLEQKKLMEKERQRRILEEQKRQREIEEEREKKEAEMKEKQEKGEENPEELEKGEETSGDREKGGETPEEQEKGEDTLENQEKGEETQQEQEKGVETPEEQDKEGGIQEDKEKGEETPEKQDKEGGIQEDKEKGGDAVSREEEVEKPLVPASTEPTSGPLYRALFKNRDSSSEPPLKIDLNFGSVQFPREDEALNLQNLESEEVSTGKPVTFFEKTVTRTPIVVAERMTEDDLLGISSTCKKEEEEEENV